jgi:hypothetical protein
MVFPGDFVPALTFEGKCSYLRAKSAHLVGHLPPELSVNRQSGVSKQTPGALSKMPKNTPSIADRLGWR